MSTTDCQLTRDTAELTRETVTLAPARSKLEQLGGVIALLPGRLIGSDNGNRLIEAGLGRVVHHQVGLKQSDGGFNTKTTAHTDEEDSSWLNCSSLPCAALALIFLNVK